MIQPYIRPVLTYQDRLTNQDIKEKLKEYTIVEDITSISLGEHIRYFIIDPNTKKRKFRLGGTLELIDSEKRYIKLSNGNIKWSVQINNTIFYKKISNEELRIELKKDLHEEIMTEIQSEVKLQNDNMISKYKKLVDENKRLKKINLKLSNQINKINLVIEKNIIK